VENLSKFIVNLNHLREKRVNNNRESMENLHIKPPASCSAFRSSSDIALDHAVNQGPADIFPHGCSVAFGDAAIPVLSSVLAYDFGDDFFFVK